MCSSIGRARKKQKTYLVIADWCSGSTGVSEALSIRSTRVSATIIKISSDFKIQLNSNSNKR